MAPSRSKHSEKNKEVESGADGKRHKYRKKSNPEEPGVQKIKASLRQTRRLLAKDNLAADVRIQTERRLKSLETDLAKAELRNKERSIAVRYHKIKFFDKRKVTRKINQTKRALESSELDKKERKKLQKALLGHRVDLNYIINYPKLAKYIALYPSTGVAATTAETDQLREEHRARVREAMEKGEMDAEPEMRSNAQGDGDGNGEGEGEGEDEDQREVESDEQRDLDESDEEGEPVSAKPTSKPHRLSKPKSDESKEAKKIHKSNPNSAPTQKILNVREDEFFDT